MKSRWDGIPFFIRAGKRLPAARTEAVVMLRRPPPVVYEPGTRGPPAAETLVPGGRQGPHPRS